MERLETLLQYAASQGYEKEDFLGRIDRLHRDYLINFHMQLEDSEAMAYLSGAGPSESTFNDACDFYLKPGNYSRGADRVYLLEILVKHCNLPLREDVAKRAAEIQMRSIKKPINPIIMDESIDKLAKVRKLATYEPKDDQYAGTENIFEFSEEEVQEAESKLLDKNHLASCMRLAKASGVMPKVEDVFQYLVSKF